MNVTNFEFLLKPLVIECLFTTHGFNKQRLRIKTNLVSISNKFWLTACDFVHLVFLLLYASILHSLLIQQASWIGLSQFRSFDSFIDDEKRHLHFESTFKHVSVGLLFLSRLLFVGTIESFPPRRKPFERNSCLHLLQKQFFHFLFYKGNRVYYY